MGSKLSYKWIDLAPGAEVSEEAERFMRKGILEVYGEEDVLDHCIRQEAMISITTQ